MREPRRIIVNDRCLRGPLTGVGHYVTELLARVPQEAPDLDLLAFYSSLARRGSYSFASDTGSRRPSSLGRRPPWWIRRTALKLYNSAFTLAGRIKGCSLYHEPNHIPSPWSGPIITTIHDLSVLRHAEWHPADRVRWYECDLQAGLARTSRFIAVSEFTRQEMIDLLGLPAERITVIPLGVREVFHPRPADAVRVWLSSQNLPADYLLYAGTIEPRKNVAGLLAAYAALPAKTRERVALVLAGVTGWGRQAVDEWITRHGLAGQVHIAGYVDDESLACLYAGARALVWPTLYEGFGLPPLECMACGTPVIASNLASIPEVTGGAALLVDPLNTDELAAAISRILEDDLLTKRLRHDGPNRASRFSWQRCAQQHAEEYRRAMAI